LPDLDEKELNACLGIADGLRDKSAILGRKPPIFTKLRIAPAIFANVIILHVFFINKEYNFEFLRKYLITIDNSV